MCVCVSSQQRRPLYINYSKSETPAYAAMVAAARFRCADCGLPASKARVHCAVCGGTVTGVALSSPTASSSSRPTRCCHVVLVAPHTCPSTSSHSFPNNSSAYTTGTSDYGDPASTYNSSHGSSLFPSAHDMRPRGTVPVDSASVTTGSWSGNQAPGVAQPSGGDASSLQSAGGGAGLSTSYEAPYCQSSLAQLSLWVTLLPCSLQRLCQAQEDPRTGRPRVLATSAGD